MERGQIVQQYHELRQYLNRANKISNESTDLVLKIEQTELFEYQLCAFVQSKFETHRLALSVRDKSRTWERAGFTKFKMLEEYCAKILNEYETIEGHMYRSIKISDSFVAKMERMVQFRFKMFLLNKNYEP